MSESVEGEYVSIEDPNIKKETEPKKSFCSFNININQIVSGLSMMGTDYNLFVINMALVVLKAENEGKPISATENSLMATMCLIGAAIGQLAFGYVGDKIGRKKGMVVSMIMTIIGAVGSAASYKIGSMSLYTTIAIWRFLLGCGAGGVYPISATLAAESAGKGHRGKSTATAFAMQGVANLLSPLICWMFIAICGKNYDLVWRLSFTMGAVPACVIIVLCYWVIETKKPQNVDKTREESDSKISFVDALKQKKYWVHLVASAGCWFLLDLTLYANILFGPTVLDKVLKADNPVSTAEQYLLVAAIGLPGYFLSAFLMDKIGSRNIQLMGFMMMCIIYCLLGFCLDIFTKYTAIMLILYGLSFFFTNFGPNATTFLLSTELYPREVRSTFNGISAATGKFGATLAGLFFKSINDKMGSKFTFVMCGCIAFVGFIITYFFVHHPKFTPRPVFQSALTENDLFSVSNTVPLISHKEKDDYTMLAEEENKNQTV